MYAYDDHGWFTGQGAGDRSTAIQPPAHGNAPIVGVSWPNYTGTHDAEWSMIPYSVPVVPTPVAPYLGSKLTSRAFMVRLGIPALRVIYAQFPNSVDLQIFKDLVLSQLTVDLADPLTINSLNTLSPTFFTAAQVTTILTSPVLVSELL